MGLIRDLLDYLRLPWTALPDMQADIARLQLTFGTHMGLHEAHHHPNPSCGLEARMEALEHANRRLTERLTRMEKHMATQADIDALATKLGELQTTLASDDAGIQAEIDALKAANPAVDVTALQSAVDSLSAQVDATSALVPAPTGGGDVPPQQ